MLGSLLPLFSFTAHCENFVINHKNNMFQHAIRHRHVIKEPVLAISCAYIRLWMHLESLESTQEARVALGYHLEQLLRFFCAHQTSRVHP